MAKRERAGENSSSHTKCEVLCYFLLVTVSTIDLLLRVLCMMQPKCGRGMLFLYHIGMLKLLQTMLKTTDRSTHVDTDIS